MTARQRLTQRRRVDVDGGLVVTSFDQALSTELLTFNDFSSNTNWTTESPGWTIIGGVLTGAGGQTSVTYHGDLPITINDWCEISYEVISRTAGEVSAQVGTSSLTRGIWISSPVAVQEIGRYVSGSNIFMIVPGVGGFAGTIDNASVRKITQNTVHLMPSADGTHTLSFTLPGTPKAGQRIEMRYRREDALNYWSARIVRNAANSAWDFVLASISAGTMTPHITVTDVGTPDAIRVVTSGTTHTPYTGAGGVFTQRSAISISHLDTATGIFPIYVSAITPTRLTSEAE